MIHPVSAFERVAALTLKYLNFLIQFGYHFPMSAAFLFFLSVDLLDFNSNRRDLATFPCGSWRFCHGHTYRKEEIKQPTPSNAHTIYLYSNCQIMSLSTTSPILVFDI